MSSKTEYQPIDRPSNDIEEDTDLLRNYVNVHGNNRLEKLIWLGFILTIVVTNAFWFSLYNQQKLQYKEEQPINGRLLRIPYRFTTPYVDANLKEQNKLWADLFPPGLGAIKVEHEWAAKHHLPTAQGNASDGKAIYTVAAFHQLHCLTVIRTSLYQFNSGRKQLDPWDHITHCLDTLRQEIQCSADPTIGGISRVHECRDFEALKEWTTKRSYTDFLEEIL
ncbi:conserved hypothetical protein [Talaromyces stipitatus ATCC 10500]|uniref:Cyclochlorotine biosynthesis protein O n=1 Tax=Talaromyces stipitatus (strain ATCC 10500 / CBS 375.48 / QM 6759 / NRRL 1006) TaxID=441959 RepID=B8M0Q8_TALSN|nr:uncharacterized protein TSTA_086740 [Talaromyces stipitatus ATCC 10500]EED21441.1 conserved hypothetical protein [Talaromyces stipitatus ATCC 10500]